MGCFLLRKCKRQTIPTNGAHECHTSAMNYFFHLHSPRICAHIYGVDAALMKTIRKISNVRCIASWLAAKWIEFVFLFFPSKYRLYTSAWRVNSCK